MLISCHFRNCKALLETSVSSHRSSYSMCLAGPFVW